MCDAALFDTKAAWEKFSDYWKIFLMTFLTALLITNATRLRMMVWAVALSIGALGFKGGLLGALRGARLQGPGGFIQDNNDFALALGMGIPMMWMIGHSEKRTLLRRSMLVCVPLTWLQQQQQQQHWPLRRCRRPA